MIPIELIKKGRRFVKRTFRHASVGVGRRIGHDDRNWLRITEITSWLKFLSDHPKADILEISPGWNSMWAKVPCNSYSAVQFPEFDITKESLNRTFDIIIADQVLEHVPDPGAAVRNIRTMISPGGYAMIAVPFLFRVHARPHDYYRWTEQGLRKLLVDAGFEDQYIESHAWGNKACARAHIGGPVRSLGFGKDLSNDPEYPIMVWAFAQARRE